MHDLQLQMKLDNFQHGPHAKVVCGVRIAHIKATYYVVFDITYKILTQSHLFPTLWRVRVLGVIRFYIKYLVNSTIQSGFRSLATRKISIMCQSRMF